MPPGRAPLRQTARFSLPPRRFILAFALACLVSILLLSNSSTPSIPSVPSIPASVHDISNKAHLAAGLISNPKLPHLYNPFGDAAHGPPEQENSTSGETKWYSALNWLQNPFSSMVTLDENRALLPPLPPRKTIYTFYDTAAQKDARAIEAEYKLLLTWRRAWWAQGFKPIVLGRPEAAKHRLYGKLKGLSLELGLEADVERWLAWAHMGGGVLVNWLVLPMAPRHDPTIVALRKESFERLTNYKGLQGGLLAGQVDHVNEAIEQAFSSDTFKKAPSLFAALPSKVFNTVAGQEGLAFYDMATIKANYKVIANQLASSQASGLHVLQQLINAHLHITWQSNFPSGIAVLQPYPKETIGLVSYAARLAHDLIRCPVSPMSSSCPPNRPDCQVCTSYNSKLVLSTPSAFLNKSSVFTIGTVPHPYTFASLKHNRDLFDARFIRRNTQRDLWVIGATEDLLGPDIGGPQRLPSIKSAVAGDHAIENSIWVTAELEEQMDRDWVFGFEIPKNEQTHDWHGITKEVDPSNGAKTKAMTNPEALARAGMLLEKSKAKIKAKAKARAEVDMVEAWNMADAEAWRFVRAFATRRRIERWKWEEEERKFAGAENRGKGWGAWLMGG